MEIPKILQAKRNGTFYDYIEETLNRDPIFGNMEPSELEAEHQRSLLDFEDIISESKTPWEDRYEELI